VPAAFFEFEYEFFKTATPKDDWSLGVAMFFVFEEKTQTKDGQGALAGQAGDAPEKPPEASRIGSGKERLWPEGRAELQRSDLLTAGTADAVPIVCYRVRVHFTAEIAGPGGAVLLEQNGISIHKNFELGAGIQPQTVPKLFRQYDAT
jgi:hypothetical protein